MNSIQGNYQEIYWTLAEVVAGEDGLASIQWLSPSEKDRFKNMRFPKRQYEWLHGRRVAKSLLISSMREMREAKPADLTIENEPEGAPYVSYKGERLDLSLSISHRNRLALGAYTLAAGWSIGADIEKVESRQPVFVEDYFTKAEQELIGKATADCRDVLVTLIWSAKEACLKALHKGLRLDTRSVEIYPVQSDHNGWAPFQVRCKGTEPESWRGWWQKRGDYVLTMVLFRVDRKSVPIAFEVIQISML